MICERLLKQQEAKLRYEYETVIADRLQSMFFRFSLESFEKFVLFIC